MKPQPAVVVTASPLTVKQEAARTAIKAKRLASYTPLVGDDVAVVPFAGSVLVLGKVVA